MKTIVMTGGTAGIGLAAVERMQREADVRIVLGARGKPPASVEALPLDLTQLDSVRRFAAAAGESLGESPIDVLLLNAGLQVGNIAQRTEDGFETTFAANHLAHYLLLRLLTPRLAEGAIVVLTTSSLHDPVTNGIAPPEHADARRLAHGEVKLIPGARDPMAMLRAYAASKLCNILTARALASSAVARERRLRVVAFNPGFTPGTKLTRNHSRAFKLLFGLVVPIVSPFQRMNTAGTGGQLLADLALGKIAPPGGRLYASQVKRQLLWPEPSELARDDAVMGKLWRDSAVLVGLPL
ncbi:MAG TPA: SDR family NAD(P)-dependent oxidoreductase [Myxococcota bacterium]|nr:SDR family NAD(P)-dependent oxidoreductase [Myxococcota bacterium]